MKTNTQHGCDQIHPKRQIEKQSNSFSKQKHNPNIVEKSTSELAGSFAHSLRNPLTSIKMRLYSLSRLNLPESQHHDLNVIVDEINNIESLVKSFLKLSRSSKINPEPVSLSEIVEKTLELLKPEMEHKQIQILGQGTKNLPLCLIDPNKLKEALINLIVNGYEAVENGDGVITICEEVVDHELLGYCALVEIRDNGKGIPKETQPRLFEPFFTTKADGTGLGLCIAKNIIETHGGTLTFSSIEGEGSIFSIHLPCIVSESKELELVCG